MGEAWDHHIYTNPRNQLMACSVKIGVIKSRAFNMEQVNCLPAAQKTDSKRKPNKSEIHQTICQVIQTVHEDLDLLYLRSFSNPSVAILCYMLKDQLRVRVSAKTLQRRFSHKYLLGTKYFTFLADAHASSSFLRLLW